MTDETCRNVECDPRAQQEQVDTMKCKDDDAVHNDTTTVVPDENIEETATATTEVLEVNFRLDPHGRTLPSETDDTNLPSNLDYTTRVSSTYFERIPVNTENSHTNERIQRLSDDEERNLLDDILLDCDIADSCLMPRTFWIDHTMPPRCHLEQMAYDILQHYCPIPTSVTSSSQSNSTTHPQQQQPSCGAEWWVQIRPPPETMSRYTAPTYHHQSDTKRIGSTAYSSTDDNTGVGSDNDENHECNTTSADTDGISFHWDKDEELRILCNGTVYVHPHLSTVTYLTDGGDDYAVPTFIAEHVRIHNLTGEWVEHNSNHDNNSNNNNDDNDSHPVTPSAFISWPSKGKHLCFDGRYLHAAPSNLLNTSKKLASTNEVSSTNHTESKYMIRRQRRYTFLVNIWMYHHPFNVHPFPESMIDKLSGSSEQQSRVHGGGTIRFVLEDGSCSSHPTYNDEGNKVPEKTFTHVTNVNVLSDTTTRVSDQEMSPHDITTKVQQFVWPMGDHDSNETIHASIPIDIVQSKKRDGGNIRIQWNVPMDDHTNNKNKNNHNSTTSSSHIGMFLRKEPTETICNVTAVHDDANTESEPASKRSRSTGDTNDS